MGIDIRFSVDETRILPEEWGAAYADAVKVAHAGKLCNIETLEYEGHPYYAGVLTESEKRGDAYGLTICGELETGSTMESHFIPRFLGRDDAGNDSSGSVLAYYLDMPWAYGLKRPDMTPILYNKTYGTCGHILLLSIACVFISHFPDACFLGGGITAGQVYRAMELAEGVLGHKLNAPVAYDMEQLLPRVKVLAEGDEHKALRLFFEIYRGLRGSNFNRFVKEHFGHETIYSMFLSLSHHESMHSILEDWLLLDLPFRDVARMLVTDPVGLQYAPEDFVKEVLRAKLHVKDKLVFDPLEANNAETEPDDTQSSSNRVAAMVYGVLNETVGRYIPLDELKADCAAVFDDAADVDALFASAARNLEESKEQQTLEIFWRDYQDETAERQRREAAYDITTAKGLFDWGPGNTVVPELWDELKAFLKSARDLTVDTREKFRRMSRDKRLHLLTGIVGKRLMLPEERWQALFESVMDDGEIDLWLPLLCIDASNADVATLIRAMIYSEPLFRYLNAALSEEASV